MATMLKQIRINDLPNQYLVLDPKVLVLLAATTISPFPEEEEDLVAEIEKRLPQLVSAMGQISRINPVVAEIEVVGEFQEEEVSEE